MSETSQTLSVPALDFQGLVTSLYEAAAEDADPQALRVRLCRGLAVSFGFALVLLVRRSPSGIVACEAASAENALWLALQRLPERWDGSLVGEGPAARLLKTGERRIGARIDEDEFFPWRTAAQAEGVRSAVAYSLDLPQGPWALEIFSPEDDPALEPPEGLARALQTAERFLRNLETHQSRRLLAAALESAGNPAFLTDREGTIVWSNEAFARLSGHARERILGSNPRVLQSGKQGVRYYRELWNTIRSGQVWSGDTVDRDRAGAAYSIRQTISPVALDGRYSHYLSIQSDITGQKRLEREHELRLRRDETTQLLTRAAFEEAVDAALRRNPERVTLVAISARALVDSLATAPANAFNLLAGEIGDRLLTVVEAPALDAACAGLAGRGEYFVLLEGDAATPVRRDGVLADLKQALEAEYRLPDRTLQARFQFATVQASSELGSVDALIRAADARFPGTPATPARRTVPGLQ